MYDVTMSILVYRILLSADDKTALAGRKPIQIPLMLTEINTILEGDRCLEYKETLKLWVV